MVDFSVKSTDIGKTNYRGYVKKAVEDKSKAMEIANKFDSLSSAGTLAIETYEAIDKQNTLGGVAEQIGTVIDEQAARSLDGQASLESDIANKQNELGLVEKNMGYDGTYPQMLNSDLSKESRGIVNSLSDKTTQLENARQQGVMGDLELKERLAKITREAIAQNPAYAAEIMAHVGQVANMNNLTARVAADTATIKAMGADREAMEKEIRTQAYKQDINFEYDENGRINYDAAMMQIRKKQQIASSLKEWKQMVETNTSMDALKSRQLIMSGGPMTLNAMVQEGVDGDLRAVMNDTTINVAEKKAKMNKIVNDYKLNVRKTYTINGHNPSDSAIKDYVSQADSMIDGIYSIYNETSDYSLLSTASKNKAEYLKSDAMASFYQSNPSTALTLGVAELLGDFSSLSRGKELQVELESSIVNFAKTYASGITEPRNVNKVNEMFKPISKGKSSASLLTMKLLDNQIKNQNDSGELKETLAKRLLYINKPDSQYASNEIASLIKDLADPRFNEGMNYIKDPALSSQLADTIEQYKPALKNGIERMKEKHPGISFKVVESTGILEVRNAPGGFYNDSQSVGDLRSIYETFNAYVNVNRLNPSKSYEQFYMDIGAMEGVPTEKK
jgi:hypothetical protein